MALRRELLFLLLFAFVVAAESVVLASRAYALHPEAVRAAVIFDLSVVPAAIWWLFFRSRRTTARVALIGIALSALLFGREVRLLAAPIELGVLYIAYTSVRKALRVQGDVAAALREALGDSVAARVFVAEISVLWFALFSWGRRAPAGFTTYKRAGWGAIYFALAMVTLAEGAALEVLWPHWWTIALHVYALVWLLGDFRAMQLRPIQVSETFLQLRIGLRWEASIPLASIAAVDTNYTNGLKLGVLGSPNLHLQLRAPAELHGLFGRRKRSDSLLLQVDDPAALTRLLEQVRVH